MLKICMPPSLSLLSFLTIDIISSGGTMRKFYTVNGDTAVTNEFTTKLKKEGKTEVSKEKREFTLAFCRISTRPGIDIQETQDKCPGLNTSIKPKQDLSMLKSNKSSSIMLTSFNIVQQLAVIPWPSTNDLLI